jgi:hypothetical protein
MTGKTDWLRKLGNNGRHNLMNLGNFDFVGVIDNAKRI